MVGQIIKILTETQLLIKGKYTAITGYYGSIRT